jgi:hypothetical protein
MSQIKQVNIIQRELELLNSQYVRMVEASEVFLAFLFNPYLFQAYSEYHTLLTNFANRLITMTPYLPNESIPMAKSNMPSDNPSDLKELAGVMKNNEMTLIKGLLIFLPNIPMYALAGLKIIPWVVPVIYSAASVALFCAPQLLQWYLDLTKKQSEEANVDTTNPSEWISKDMQILSDKYDGIRVLIMKQDVKLEQLSSKYRTVPEALYSREAQEKELFPNECLTVVRKIMVFCTNAYNDRKQQLISHLPNSPSQSVSQQPAVAG